MVGVGRDLCGSPSPTPCRSRLTYSRLHRTVSRWIFNISRAGDSTTSLDKSLYRAEHHCGKAAPARGCCAGAVLPWICPRWHRDARRTGQAKGRQMGQVLGANSHGLFWRASFHPWVRRQVEHSSGSHSPLLDLLSLKRSHFWDELL